MMREHKASESAITDMLGDNQPFKGHNVRIGQDVVFAKGVILHDNVSIERGSVIGPNVVIGEPLADSYSSSKYRNPRTVIGRDSIIRAGSVIYAGCKLGSSNTTGHYAVLRERTFSGENCSFGTFFTSDGDVKMGDGCRYHYYAHICKKARIGDNVWMFPRSTLLNDMHPPCGKCMEGPVIGDRAIIGSAANISPKVRIGRDALIAAMSMVTKDVPDGMLAMGVPARLICRVSRIKCQTGLVDHPYPWKAD